jgi:hypothetical protein
MHYECILILAKCKYYELNFVNFALVAIVNAKNLVFVCLVQTVMLRKTTANAVLTVPDPLQYVLAKNAVQTLVLAPALTVVEFSEIVLVEVMFAHSAVDTPGIAYALSVTVKMVAVGE